MKTPNREPRPMAEVMDDLKAQLPDMIGHFYTDRSWLWYCGPSLAGEANKPTRETLSALGFRYAPKGHPMEAGGLVGSWSHSCAEPRKRIFRRRNFHHTNNNQHDEPASDPIGMLAALGV